MVTGRDRRLWPNSNHCWLKNRKRLPQWGLPVLPFERAVGANDLAVQGIYLPSGLGQGIRFIGRFSQDASAVTNSNLYYIYLGLSNDGNYLIAFFYPIHASMLADNASYGGSAGCDQGFPVLSRRQNSTAQCVEQWRFHP